MSMNMERDDANANHRAVLSTVMVFLGTVAFLVLLTFCGSSSEDGPGGTAGLDGGSHASGGGGSSAGSTTSTATGFGGHTAGCPQQCGCNGFPPCSTQDASSDAKDGAGETATSPDASTKDGAGGSGGMGGFAGAGFGGHTAGCPQQCGCAGFPPCASPDAGADARSAANRAFSRGMDRRWAKMFTQELGTRACYALTGYEPDPCLPADDSLVPWLGKLPATCQPHVVDGPVAGFNDKGRTCCYSVSCDELGTGSLADSR